MSRPPATARTRGGRGDVLAYVEVAEHQRGEWKVTSSAVRLSERLCTALRRGGGHAP